MYRIKTFNKIAPAGLGRFDPARYAVSEQETAEEGILVRSADLLDYSFPPSLLAISRAGAGVNNIPLERCAQEDRYDFVNDILVRYKNIKRIYAYELDTYWSNIASVESYYETNMDFLKPEVRDYFFRQYPEVYSKVGDLPPAKYNPGADVRNSLVSSGTIINGVVDSSVLFKQVYVGNNCVIKNSIILNDVYIGDNTVIENCIVESRDTIRANTTYIGTPENIKIVVEKNERYTL